MEEILKLTAKETGQRMLTVSFQDSPDAPLEFSVVVKFPTARLHGPMEQERYVLLASLASQLDLVLRANYRNKSDK